MTNRKMVVLLNNIRSRENVGAIFRTSDGAGVGEVIISGITPKPPHEKISKTALGAENDVPWRYVKDAWRVVQEYKDMGYQIVSLERNESSINILNANFSDKVLLIIGNEVDGVADSLLRRSDLIVSIPMLGKKESLNVSVAFGIAAYLITNK